MPSAKFLRDDNVNELSRQLWSRTKYPRNYFALPFLLKAFRRMKLARVYTQRTSRYMFIYVLKLRALDEVQVCFNS